MTSTVLIRRAGVDEDWPEVLAMLHEAFAYMAGRIDPPSSLHHLTASTVRASAGHSVLLAEDPALVGCVFLTCRNDALYLGKLAVAPNAQGRGIGQSLLKNAEAEAWRLNMPALELETRIELTENHAMFAAYGFVKSGETSHAGYARPTSITMRKPLI